MNSTNISLTTFDDCNKCRKCCIFNETELSEAPLITNEIKLDIIHKFNMSTTDFEAIGSLWRIKLKAAERPGHWVCPMYDANNNICLIQSQKPYNCVLYPFYVMRKEDKLIIGLSQVCPVTAKKNDEFLRNYANGILKVKIVEQIEAFPEYIMDFRPEAKILTEI